MKLDHFIDFINRSHFYQDVAFGTRVFKLENGEELQMPNIVRIVTRSTMVALYLKYCQEENFTPLSRATMFRILDVREASQRTSLRGLDNTAADGAAGFNTLKTMVSHLERLGGDRVWAEDTLKRLKAGKLYLNVDYPSHCSDENSPCKDHCRSYALSDPKEKGCQQPCSHDHFMKCDQCEDLKQVIRDIEQQIESIYRSGRSSHEQREEFEHDVKQAAEDVFAWKPHILRSVHQDKAKEDILRELDDHTILIVNDWAMKFLPQRYREKQSQWFGKRGLNWHISSVISKREGKLRTQSFVHLFDSSNQDWYSVCAILENLLKTLKKENPNISKAYLRSDEAGCYHNNMLIAACQDLSQLTDVHIVGYHFSEPQKGKDVCDRIICPLKTSLKKYCNEGNDILTATDMRTALEERPVKGATACVAEIDEVKNTLDVKRSKDSASSTILFTRLTD